MTEAKEVPWRLHKARIEVASGLLAATAKLREARERFALAVNEKPDAFEPGLMGAALGDYANRVYQRLQQRERMMVYYALVFPDDPASLRAHTRDGVDDLKVGSPGPHFPDLRQQEQALEQLLRNALEGVGGSRP